MNRELNVEVSFLYQVHNNITLMVFIIIVLLLLGVNIMLSTNLTKHYSRRSMPDSRKAAKANTLGTISFVAVLIIVVGYIGTMTTSAERETLSTKIVSETTSALEESSVTEDDWLPDMSTIEEKNNGYVYNINYYDSTDKDKRVRTKDDLKMSCLITTDNMNDHVVDKGLTYNIHEMTYDASVICSKT